MMGKRDIRERRGLGVARVVEVAMLRNAHGLEAEEEQEGMCNRGFFSLRSMPTGNM
jgi:hypothetical protein